MDKELITYERSDGTCPFDEWLEDLRDRKAVARVRTRLDRAKLGNLGQTRNIGEGVIEMKIDYGPGYRLYVAHHGVRLLILLCGGDKSTQDKDIAKAQDFWADFRRRI